MHNEAFTTNRDGDRSRALVPQIAATETPGSRHARPLANFLMQLIACERRLAAYRPRRRADPAEASACYGRTQNPEPAGPRRFERSF